ncbi:MAG: hypothetical protein P8J14_02735 [Emcibacteraceae bacterium]|nr:hypothetical protein [Emcibacteraceae bacterium]
MSENKNVRQNPVVTAHPSSLKHPKSNAKEERSLWESFAAHWSVALSSILTIFWLSFCVFYVITGPIIISNLTPVELSMLITGGFIPLVFVWLICLITLKINPIEANHRALENGLEQLLNPVEITQDRIKKLINSVTLEIEKIDLAGYAATEQFQKLDENVKAQIETLNNVISEADKKSANLKNRYTEEKDSLVGLSADIEAITSEILEKAKIDINETGKSIKEQIIDLEKTIQNVTTQSTDHIASASDYYGETANDISRISSELENSIKQNINEITSTVSLKAATLEKDISNSFQGLEERIDQKNETVIGMIIENTLKIEDLLGGTLTILAEQSAQIESSLADVRMNMLDNTSLLQDENKALEKYTSQFQTRMKETQTAFQKQHEGMLSCISVIEDGLHVATDKLKNNSTRLGAHGQKVIENILSLSKDLSDQILSIQNQGKNSLRMIENASIKASDNLLSNETETKEVIDTWLQAAHHAGSEHSDNMKKIESLIAELVTIEKSTAKSVSASEEKIKRVSNELLHSSDRIHIASNSAVEAVEKTSHALEKNAEKYQQMINAIQLSSQSLATNANAIEGRLKRVNSEKFSDISAKIIEKLQSDSIDISKYLEGEVPKELWEKYIAGDKNIFIRKIKKHIGKKTTTDIRLYYLEDRDFRKNADSFVQIFEELLETFTEATENIYIETLITSDVGKVYFALADATGRLK